MELLHSGVGILLLGETVQCCAQPCHSLELILELWISGLLE